MTCQRPVFLILIVFYSLLVSGPAWADVEDGAESRQIGPVQVHQYGADSRNLLLIFPSGHGITNGLRRLARKLAEQGVEVWLADPFLSWFLPESDASLKELPADAYPELIRRAHEHTDQHGKDLFLLSFDRGVQGMFQAIRQWQTAAPDARLGGVLLLSPDLYRQTPQAGEVADLLPIASATNQPVFLLSTEKSTLALRTAATVKALESGGSELFQQRLAGVRNRFFFRPDATITEQMMAERLPRILRRAMNATRSIARRTRSVPPIMVETDVGHTAVKKTGRLLPYEGDLAPPDFLLKDVTGRTQSLDRHRGKVVLLNFWASWCPPCVHEMPSMNRLEQSLGADDFITLAINLGEQRADIEAFLKRHPVAFPVLLDPDQSLPKSWRVFAFPTSYLIDGSGQIRYSVAGGLEWDSTDVRQIIQSLIADESSAERR